MIVSEHKEERKRLGFRHLKIKKTCARICNIFEESKR